MGTTSDRIKEGMAIRGLKQADLVERTGISKGALSSYISGKYAPKQNNIYRIAKALNVNEAWLMGADIPMGRDITSKPQRAVTIKVLGRVAAGIPIEAIEDVIDTEEITVEMAKTGDFFGLQIHGDSMEPRMYENDVVIVRKQEDAESGDIVIAMINGNDATCKRLIKYTGGISLVSLNSKYTPMMFSNQEIIEKPVRILGKVVELRGKL